MTILGIDPGLASTGFGIIQSYKLPRPRSAKRGGQTTPASLREAGRANYKLVNYGCISTDPRFSIAERLEKIHKELTKIIKKYKPSKTAIEELFFAKNTKTAMKVGEARGVILLTAKEMKIPIFEFTPLQVKLAITSYGRASKSQMQKMVKVLLRLEEIPKPDDAADALATAITCAQHNVILEQSPTPFSKKV